MIKTKDEWERVKVVADSQSGPSLQHAVDTIEALREVAREARSWVFDEESRIEEALDALPDWITENDR